MSHGANPWVMGGWNGGLCRRAIRGQGLCSVAAGARVRGRGRPGPDDHRVGAPAASVTFGHPPLSMTPRPASLAVSWGCCRPVDETLSRQPTWRPSIARLPVLPTQADSPPGSRAAPDQGPTPPTVSAAPSTALDLSTDTLRRAIAEAARASDSVAAQAGGVTRLSQAEQRDEALHESERQDCLTPVDKRKRTKSPIHLGGLLAIPGLVVDVATGQCSTH